MKRTWFAILFLLLVAGLCIFEQHTVKTTFENMETLLQSMDAAAAEENYPEAERKARQLQNIWTARYPTLCVLMEHRALQEAGVPCNPWLGTKATICAPPFASAKRNWQRSTTTAR